MPYEIEVGWGIEPPIIGYRNDFVFEINQLGDNPGVKVGVTNAFNNLEATAKFGGVTKILDIGSDSQPGHYFSHVIPTKTGTITISLKGDIDGVPINIEIPIEDVEATSVLDFPPSTGLSSDQDITSLKNSITSLQNEVSRLKSDKSSSTQDSSYDFAVLGLSISAAAIILAIIALIKRK
jgi:hypothetical protein